MVRTLETKACSACAQAKRRCGRQTPQCLRCRTKDLHCEYPASKPARFVLWNGEDEGEEAVPVTTLGDPIPSTETSLFGPGADIEANIGAEIQVDGRLNSLMEDNNQLSMSWFASRETWNVRFTPADKTLFCLVDIDRYIERIRRWLAEWVETGGNAFMHARLYRERFPRCIQDAYSTLSSYLHKTVANQRMVFQIIEERIEQLLADNRPSVWNSSSGEKDSTSAPRDILEHIARVHALLIYQFICLYDGETRLRHVAESSISTLHNWMREMIHNASQMACLGGCMIYPPDALQQANTSSFTAGEYAAHTENLLWYSWIMAESVRRTWIVGSSLQLIFHARQRRNPVPCQGGMMLTTRQGVWEASSAAAWERLCSGVNVGLMQMADADQLFTQARPDEVNEFAKVVLEVTFGTERMERWGVEEW